MVVKRMAYLEGAWRGLLGPRESWREPLYREIWRGHSPESLLLEDRGILLSSERFHVEGLVVDIMVLAHSAFRMGDLTIPR